MSLNDLSATQAVDKIRKGEITSEELVQACLERIEQIDGEIEAWAYLNPDYALEQARKLDIIRQAGDPIGQLHGIPVGIKDIIDTAHVPTELGTPIHSGRVPFKDAWVVNRLRQAGAVIMGKTMHRGKQKILMIQTAHRADHLADPRRLSHHTWFRLHWAARLMAPSSVQRRFAVCLASSLRSG